jgi:tetrahydrodipicolinate N-succinyltransferase
MTNYENKEMKTVEEVAQTLEKMDKKIAELNSLDQQPKKHTLKKWVLEKETLHEIKHILHEANRYEKYDEKEMAEFEKEKDSFTF